MNRVRHCLTVLVAASASLAGVSVYAPVAFAQAQPAPASAPAAVPGPGPQELIQKVSQDLLRDLDANRAKYTSDPKQLRALVDRYLLPHFDIDYAARLVMGKHWRTATEAQRKRFVDAFYQSLMRNYGDAVLEFSSDRLSILPFRGDLASGNATVRTEVKRSDGTPVPVNYSVRATPQGWKAWDVTIEGISYVKNYRTDFGAEIDQKGIDSVIRRLEAQNASGKPDPDLTAPGKAASSR
jgi:phospholipid transport system substrate-binding protein